MKYVTEYRDAALVRGVVDEDPPHRDAPVGA